MSLHMSIFWSKNCKKIKKKANYHVVVHALFGRLSHCAPGGCSPVPLSVHSSKDHLRRNGMKTSYTLVYVPDHIQLHYMHSGGVMAHP